MLHTLRPKHGSVKKRKRVARGISAGGGKTAGRGTKGQQSRVGKGRRFGFEGGQSPLIRRQPKLGGFRSPNKPVFEIVNIDTLERVLDAGSYDAVALRERRILRTKHPLKLLGRGTVSKKFALTVAATSASAEEAITNAGGSVTVSRS